MFKLIVSRLPLLFIVSLILALIAYLNWPEAKVEKQKYQRVVAVKVFEINKTEYRDVIEGLGTSRANEQVLITSKYTDLVDTISFNDGQKVKTGEVLVKLNNQEEVAKVRELEANLAESVAQLNRFQDLFAKKATSKSQVDQQEAKAKAISAQLLSAKTKLNDLTIRSPFDGVLGFRQISLGSLINSGDVITSLDDITTIKVDFTVPEHYLTTVSVGQMVNATNSAYRNKNFKGRITSIDSRIDSVTRTLKVRAEIPNPSSELRPGMLLNVEVLRHVDEILQVPESAVIPIEDKHYVFVVHGDSVKREEIAIGRRKPGVVEILSGVDEGTQVVTEGALKLRDGSKVSVLEQ